MAPAVRRQRERMANSAETAAMPNAVASQPSVPTVVIRPSRGWASLQLRPLWDYRELLGFLVWRDVKVRYKQTVLGVLWIILQPVVSMVIFSALFGGLLNAPSGGVPYPIFLYSALLALNPMTGVVEGFRWALLGGYLEDVAPPSGLFYAAIVIAVAVLLSGLIFFRRTERTFADVI